MDVETTSTDDLIRELAKRYEAILFVGLQLSADKRKMRFKHMASDTAYRGALLEFASLSWQKSMRDVYDARLTDQSHEDFK